MPQKPPFSGKWFPSIIVLVVFAWLTPDSLAGISAKEVADGIRTAQARFTDATVKYTLDFPVDHTPDGGGRLLFECTFCQRGADGWMLYDCRVSSVDKTAGTRTLRRDFVNSFNGNNTTSFNRQPDPKGRLIAQVTAGLVKSDFQDPRPLERIWEPTGMPLANLIGENPFKVISEEADVPGGKAILLEGTSLEGRMGNRIWIDRNRGFLPVKIQTFFHGFDGPYSEQVLQDIRELPNGIWFPKTIKQGKPDGDPEKDIALLGFFRITEINFDKLPDDAFRLRLPAKTLVNDHTTDSVYVLRTGTEGPKTKKADGPDRP